MRQNFFHSSPLRPRERVHRDECLCNLESMLRQCNSNDLGTDVIPAISMAYAKLDPSSLLGATFSLVFAKQSTDPIPWDADEHEVLQKLEMLSTVGDILVSLDVDVTTSDRSWRVTLNPYEGKSSNSLFNFQNLPPIEASNVDGSISVLVETVEEGNSPFRVFVSPAEPSLAKTTAHDHPGVLHFEGLSTGVYKSESYFFVQSRDIKFSNEIQDGPLREVQII